MPVMGITQYVSTWTACPLANSQEFLLCVTSMRRCRMPLLSVALPFVQDLSLSLSLSLTLHTNFLQAAFVTAATKEDNAGFVRNAAFSPSSFLTTQPVCLNPMFLTTPLIIVLQQQGMFLAKPMGQLTLSSLHPTRHSWNHMSGK